jgi:hypothetical protein
VKDEKKLAGKISDILLGPYKEDEMKSQIAIAVTLLSIVVFLNPDPKAFAATLRDPALLAEAKKMKLDIEPVSGEEIDGYVKQIYSMSNAVKRNLSFLVKSTQKQSN